MSYQPKTPGVVMGAAILLFIYGGLTMVCGSCSGVLLAANQNDPQGVKEMLAKEAPGYMIVQIGNLGVGLLFGLLMILAGVGLLQLMPIARWGTFAILAVKILQNIAISAYGAIYIFPTTQRIMAQQMQNPNQPPLPFDIGMIFSGSMRVGLVLELLIVFVYILIIIILLNLKSSRDAFSGVSQPDPDEEEHEPRPRHSGYDDDDDDHFYNCHYYY